MKTKIISVVLALLLASLACGIPTQPLATGTPTATPKPTATKVQVPTTAPTQTETSVPTPFVDQCENPENKAFVYNDNFILRDWAAFDQKMMSHFPGEAVIIAEGLASDADKIREIQSQIMELEAPPFYQDYHNLETEFLSAYVTALDAAEKGDIGRTFAYLDETQKYYDLLQAEIARLQRICPVENIQTS